MKVVLLKSEVKNRGGLEKYARRLAGGFVQKGANVSVLTTKLPEVPDPAISYQVFPSDRWLSACRLEKFDRQVRRYLKKNPADIILGLDRCRLQTHLRLGNGVHAAYLKSRFYSDGRLKTWMCRINPLHLKILQLEQEALEYPGLKKIFTNSWMVREELIEHYEVDPSKIMVIHNGVEWNERATDFSLWPKARREAFQKYNLDESAFHLLFVGSGFRRKGLDPLLDALSTWKFKDFHLSILGKDRHTDRYAAKIKQMGLKNRVHLFGKQEDVTPFYQLADALVIPSFYDPFANVTVEALAMGLFVISSLTNGGHEVLNENSGSIIQNLLDPSSFQASLDRALLSRKTTERAAAIRSTVAGLDFSIQLPKLIDACD